MNRPRLMLFAKDPIPGHCKTRLAARVGDEAAAELARAFLVDSYRRFASISAADLELWGEALGRQSFETLLGPVARFRSQGEGDLGQRLERAFSGAFQNGHAAIALGTDTPGLPLDRVREACAELAAGQVALGPSEDGGFYLLGLPEPFPGWRRIFESQSWGTSEVLARTRDVLNSCPVAWCELASARDIDEWADLVQWSQAESDRGQPGDPEPTRTRDLARTLLRRFEA